MFFIVFRLCLDFSGLWSGGAVWFAGKYLVLGRGKRLGSSCFWWKFHHFSFYYPCVLFFWTGLISMAYFFIYYISGLKCESRNCMSHWNSCSHKNSLHSGYIFYWDLGSWSFFVNQNPFNSWFLYLFLELFESACCVWWRACLISYFTYLRGIWVWFLAICECLVKPKSCYLELW